MRAERAFLDTNVLLYLLSGEAAKADRAEALLARSGVISVQVLNEFASVARRKLSMEWTEIEEVLRAVRAVCRVDPATEETHDLAMALAKRRRFSIYDALIVASALIAEVAVLYSEDLQHGQVFADQLRIEHPFRDLA
jgi:predicted nucleic acid-binding protein